MGRGVLRGLLGSRRLWAYVACLALLSALALVVTAPQARAALPVQVGFTLEGCDRPAGLTLPRPDGKFICPDAEYSGGNQGSNWSELDLVPMRLTARIRPEQTFVVAIAADAEEGGSQGFDLISVPQVNGGLSGPTCRAPVVGAQERLDPGIDNIDVTIVRRLTITSAGDETCVYDWYERLAVGAGFNGSSLHTSLRNENLTSSGVGTQSVSLNPGSVKAQGLSKTIKAARGDGFLWSLSKTNVASTGSVDTCATDPTGSFTTTISWTRTPVTGDVTWTTQVFATNPSGRQLNIRVEDVVSAGGTVVDRTTGPVVAVPALSTNVKVLDHSGTAPASATTVSDTATATYLDPDTGTTVPGTTSATASASVTTTSAGNPTAQVTDVTTANQPLALTGLSTGTADVGLGDFVSTPITWTSGTVNASGSATLTFVAALPDEFIGVVAVPDEATLTDGLGLQVRSSALASVAGTPSPPRLNFVKNVDVPPSRDATFFFSLWLKGADGEKTTVDPVLDGPVTIPAGASSSSSVEVTVPPSPFGYIWEEIPAPGYVVPDPGELDPMGVCDSLTGTVANTRAVGTIEVTKVVEGSTLGASATTTVLVDCSPGTTYDESLTVTPGVPVETGAIPTGTSCTVSEPDPPPGYELVDIIPSSVVVTAGPDPVEVTVTNRRLIGELTVTKVLDGAPAGADTTFAAEVDCEPGDTYDTQLELTVTDPATQASSAPLPIPVGLTCTVTEPDVPDGWALAGLAPDAGQVTIGTEPLEVTITNTRVQGSLVVQKVTEGAALGADTVFTLGVDCSDGFDETVELDVGTQGTAFEVIDGIASGSTCTITEDDPPDGWELVDIVPNPVVIGTDPSEPASVAVTNRRQTGRLDIVKQAVGPIAGAGQNFTVHLECPGDQYDTDLTMRVPGDDGSTTATVGGIPTGVQCTLSETDVPAGWELTGIEPNPVTVTDSDTEVEATITNTRVLGGLTVTKQLSGDVAGADTSFAVHVDCPAAGIDQDLTLTVTDGESASETIGDIPTGVACSVTETELPDGWRLGLIEPQEVEIGGGDPAVVTVTNIRETGGLGITKNLSGPISGASTTFSAFMDCDGEAYDRTVSITVTPPDLAETVLIDGIPTGTHCVFTEPNIPPQWDLGGIASNEITIDTPDLLEINVVNVREVGAVTVVKRLNDTLADDVSFDLTLDCSDDFYDTEVPVTITAGSASVSEEFTGIPTGVTCAVTETALPQGWELESIEPSSVTSGEQTATITVSNTVMVSPPPTASPSATVAPTTPPTTAVPSAPPSAVGDLAFTGAQLWAAILAALLALTAGGVLVFTSRRHRH
jgi:hypothetical protein